MKFWSISTSIRNPERIPDFMRAIAIMEGRTWDIQAQTDYYIHQIALRIRSKIRRTYLSADSLAALDSTSETLTFDQAKKIYEENNYIGDGMRGRQDIKVLSNLGLVDKSEKVVITPLGRAFLNNEVELSEVMLNFDFKWQVPEPEHTLYTSDNGYGIRPFIGTLALINKVNDLWSLEGNKPVGLTWAEFCTFALTLTHYSKIDEWAQTIVTKRNKVISLLGSAKENKETELLDAFLEQLLEEGDILETVKNTLKDYGDNAFRYFKQTRMLILRGSGFHVDISEVSLLQAKMLIEAEEYKPINFVDAGEYRNFMQDLTSFRPPWANLEKSRQIEIELEKLLRNQGVSPNTLPSLKTSTSTSSLLRESPRIAALRKTLTDLNLQALAVKATSADFLRSCASDYERLRRKRDITEAEEKKLKKPVQLEYLSFKAFLSMNDLLQIKPNYPTDDEGNPLFTAGAGVADLEVFYKDFNLVCEVTMLTDRSQWVNEGQPVQRHLFEFTQKYSDKVAIGVFLAPTVHPDTRNTFKQAFYGGYGSADSLRIVPFDFNTWIKIITQLSDARLQGRNISQEGIYRFLESCLPNSNKIENTDSWWDRLVTNSSILAFL